MHVATAVVLQLPVDFCKPRQGTLREDMRLLYTCSQIDERAQCTMAAYTVNFMSDQRKPQPRLSVAAASRHDALKCARCAQQMAAEAHL